jgi:hypothetical protein
LNNNSHPATSVLPGVYQHYKGHFYQVLAKVRHSEENTTYVLYRALYGDFGLWVRPQTMFQETVLHNGRAAPRFAYIGTEPPVDYPLPAQWQTSAEQQNRLWSGFSVD